MKKIFITITLSLIMSGPVSAMDEVLLEKWSARIIEPIEIHMVAEFMLDNCGLGSTLPLWRKVFGCTRFWGSVPDRIEMRRFRLGDSIWRREFTLIHELCHYELRIMNEAEADACAKKRIAEYGQGGVSLPIPVIN